MANKILDVLRELLPDQEDRPNRFTLAVGERVREAREEAGLSQKELAEKISRRTATISEIETGKSETTITTLIYLAGALGKPLTYFFPRVLRSQLKTEDLEAEELELLSQFREIYEDSLKKIAIDQVKALAQFDPAKSIINAVEIAQNEIETEQRIKSYIKSRGKKRKSDM